jgi:CRISPR-associated protein (TIGR02584 family)
LEPVVLFTTLGPNPAPLAELLWALARHHQRLVVEAHVVVAQRGAIYLEGELLVPGGPLDQLVALLGEELAHGPTLHVHRALLPDGSPLADDEDPDHADAYQAAVWNAAVAARQAAGDRPVVFALAAGRRRTMVAMLTMAYQMLARPQDVCLDVRVDDPRAEGGSGFFFPEQTPALVVGPRGELDAREVEVRLVPVSLPRLRGLLRDGDMTTAQKALSAAQQAVDRAGFPLLRVDLEGGTCSVNGKPVGLGVSQFLWYATLAIERRRGDGWTPADNPTLRALLGAKPTPSWLQVESLPEHFRFARRGENADLGNNPALRTLRSKTHDAVEAFAMTQFPSHGHLLVPVTQTRPKGTPKGTPHRQRIELPAQSIELHDPEHWVTLLRSSVTLPCIFKPVFVARLEVSPNKEHLPMTTIRTSLSHPILVDWLSGIPEGRVGLTFAPGKHSTSVYVPGALWRRDLAMDLDELVRQGVTDLVCLLQDKDLKKLKIPHLVPEATARGLQVHCLPIADQGVPGSRKALVELLATVQQRLTDGASVVIHCEGGKGRTGVVAGCLLAALGASAPEALRRLHEARGPNCPENDRQRAFIERFATEARPWGILQFFGSRTSGALTLFLLQGEEEAVPPLLTLSEALARGIAGVREATGYHHVTLDNLGDLPVLCLAGDLVKGGMQDRVLRHDTLQAPRQTGLVVDACCVEQGRWGGREGDTTERFRVALEMAPAQLRRRLVNGASQGEVWQEVAQTQERLGRTRGRAVRDTRSETSLGLSLESPELQEESWRLLAPFLDGLEQGNVQGYLAHIEGVGWQMEWFATRALWEANAVRLLRALAVEALGATAGGGRAPGVEDARRWLASAALLDEVQQEQAGAAARRQRGRGGLTMALTLWPSSQVLHGVAVGR